MSSCTLDIEIRRQAYSPPNRRIEEKNSIRYIGPVLTENLVTNCIVSSNEKLAKESVQPTLHDSSSIAPIEKLKAARSLTLPCQER